MKFKFTKNKVIAALFIIVVLAAAFWCGGGALGLQGWSVIQTPKDAVTDKNVENVPDVEDDKNEGGLSASKKIELAKEMAGGTSSPGVEKGSEDYSKSQGMAIDAVTGKDKYLTDPAT